MERKQKNAIVKDLNKKMVFLSGPRQVGKTWLAKNIAKDFKNSVYLNWDESEDKEIILKKTWRQDTDLIIFDEIHKMPQWKNYLKGLYDTKEPKLKILVTGSARLETFRQSGDSLAGRYFRHRLYPLSLGELNNPTQDDMNKLIERGGFPEPFLASDILDVQRWRTLYVDGLIRTDILDFEKIHDFKAMQLVFQLLRKRVGSPVSYSSIVEDVQISPHTVKKYIQILESLYIIFRVTPYSRNIARSLLKEPKIYFYDTGLVNATDGIKFENFVAVSLLKHLHLIEDSEGKNTGLHYIKTKEGKEIDFCTVIENKPTAIIEAKLSERKIIPELKYFNEKHKIKAIQLVKELRTEQNIDNVELRNAFKFLKDLDFTN